MSAGELLAQMVARLEQAGIPYMLAGSFASTYHGQPRTTQDIDIVIHPSREALEMFLGALDKDEYYFDLHVALEALSARTQFNVIELATGWKIDFILRKQRPFSVKEFERRQPAQLFGTTVYVATAEDTIIAKLDWARESRSERQLRDVASVLAVSGDRLDRTYLEHWLSELGLEEIWALATGRGGATSS